MEKVKALLFDVFGTVVDWRSSIEAALKKAAHDKITSSTFAEVPQPVRDRVKQLSDSDWANLAGAWRDEYFKFTRSFVKDKTTWRDVDSHFQCSLSELLGKWELNGLYTTAEIENLGRAWHFLEPWPDSSQGIHELGDHLVTATLSNGNHALLRDLQKYGDLGFRKIISAEDFGAYKPSPETYLGACKMLDLHSYEVGMVAAHLNDLQGARRCGLRTVYVERPGEESWVKDREDYLQAKQWVDIWVTQDQDGIVEAAKQLSSKDSHVLDS
jgi:2-haloacid dehalogenase